MKIHKRQMLITNSYSKIIQDEFEKRLQRNARYSMRAFAKHLGISAASLSNILSGKKGLSEEAARKICKILEFNQEDTEFFCALVNSKHSRRRDVREQNKRYVTEVLRKKKRIIIDDEEFIGEIINFVILEILKVKKIKAPLSQGIIKSKMLSCPLNIQQKFLDKMVGLNMVEIVDGHYSVKHETFLVPDKIAKESQRKIHTKAMELAKYSYEHDHYDQREFYYVITPLDLSRMKEIKNKIREFADELMYEYGSPADADAIYGLCTYLYPLELQL